MPVITPTGNSIGEMIVLAKVSQKIKKPAPERKELIKRIRWSPPTNIRKKWGTTNPTKPIIPATDTLHPVSKEARINSNRLVLSIFIPKCNASSSPKEKALRSRQKT